MSGASSIEWTDATWNPVRGCSRVSEGCRNCYAERHAARFSGSVKVKDFDLAELDETVVRNLPFRGFAERTKAGARWTGRVELIPTALDWPLRRRKPLWIFVNSMSDLFHEKLSNEAIAAVFGVMAACPQHTFQILTKRPERMREWFEWVTERGGLGPYIRSGEGRSALRTIVSNKATSRFEFYRGEKVRSGKDGWAMVMNAAACNFGKVPLFNVWLGTSVENQATADERIPHLLATPAAKRFVSYEPALGPVDFSAFQPFAHRTLPAGSVESVYGILGGELNWIIVGGESGPGARPFNLAWGRSTVEQCKAASVACFVKQFGSFPRVIAGEEDISYLIGVHYREDSVRLGEPATLDLRDRKGGDWTEWPEDLRVREFPT